MPRPQMLSNLGVDTGRVHDELPVITCSDAVRGRVHGSGECCNVVMLTVGRILEVAVEAVTEGAHDSGVQTTFSGPSAYSRSVATSHSTLPLKPIMKPAPKPNRMTGEP